MQNRLAVVLELKIKGWFGGFWWSVRQLLTNFSDLFLLATGFMTTSTFFGLSAIWFDWIWEANSLICCSILRLRKRLKFMAKIIVFWMHTQCAFSAIAERTQTRPLRTCIFSNYFEWLLNNSYLKSAILFWPTILMLHMYWFAFAQTAEV